MSKQVRPGPGYSIFKSFLFFIQQQTEVEFRAQRSRNEDVPHFYELEVADGVEPLREI